MFDQGSVIPPAVPLASAVHVICIPDPFIVTLLTLSEPKHVFELIRFVMLAIGSDVVVVPFPEPVDEQVIANPEFVTVTLLTLSVPLHCDEPAKLVTFDIGIVVPPPKAAGGFNTSDQFNLVPDIKLELKHTFPVVNETQ